MENGARSRAGYDEQGLRCGRCTYISDEDFEKSSPCGMCSCCNRRSVLINCTHEAYIDDISGTFCGRASKDIRTMVLIPAAVALDVSRNTMRKYL